MTAAVQLIGVSKSYASPAGHLEVLTDVSLDVAPGSMVWLRGASGTGKTTLLCVAGLLARPTAGTVVIAGTPTERLNGRRIAHLRAAKLGFVFQQHNLIESLTALDNVMLPALATYSEARRRGQQLLAELGLSQRCAYRANLLSGGERQRVAIARALMNKPAVVLADEPITGLDGEAAAEVLRQLIAAARAGCAVIIASHDEAVSACADRTVALHRGSLTESGAAEAALVEQDAT